MSLRNAVTGAVLCGFVLSFAAAAEARGLVGKGVKAGLAVSNIGGEFGDLLEGDARIGFSGGVFVTIGLRGVFQLQPELLWVAKGATTQLELTDTSGGLIGTQDLTFALDYLEIPVLARIALPTGGPIRPSLVVGPALAIKLSSRLNSSGPFPNLGRDLDSVTRTDLGLVMGAGVDLGRGPGRFLLDARYTLGLTNVWGSQSTLNARNGTLALMAGYGF
jgi:hypothetical protein